MVSNWLIAIMSRSKNGRSLTEQLIDADLVIASAACWDFLFSKKSVEEIMRSRRKKPLLIIDIAVPRNFEPSVNEIEDVYLYSIDELSQVAEQNRKTRQDDIAAGLAIIEKNADDFIEWFNAQRPRPFDRADEGKIQSNQPKRTGAVFGQNRPERIIQRVGQIDGRANCKQAAALRN